MIDRQKLVALILVVLFTVSLVVILAYNPLGVEQDQSPVEQNLPDDFVDIGLILEIYRLCSDTISEEKVRDEFQTNLQNKVMEERFRIVSVDSEEAAEAHGLQRVLFANYTESWNRKHVFSETGTYWRSDTLEYNRIFTSPEFKGRKVVCTFYGSDRDIGRGPLLALTAETGKRVSSTPLSFIETIMGRREEDAESELRQNAIDNFWQKFPDQLPTLLFPNCSTDIEEQWTLRYEEVDPNYFNFEPPIIGNMMLEYCTVSGDVHVDNYRLRILDSRSGKKIHEFASASFLNDERMIFIHSMLVLYAIDSFSGEIIWNVTDVLGYLIAGPTLKGNFVTKPYLYPGKTVRIVEASGIAEEVYVTKRAAGTMQYELVRIHKSTGRELWRTSWGDARVRAGAYFCQASSDKVFVASKAEVYALDKETGEICWGPRTAKVKVASANRIFGYIWVNDTWRPCSLDADTGETVWVQEDAFPTATRMEVINNTLYEFHKVYSGGTSAVYIHYYAIGIPGTSPMGGVIGGGESGRYYLSARDSSSGGLLWRKQFTLGARERDKIWECGIKNGAYWHDKMTADGYEVNYIDFRSGDPRQQWLLPRDTVRDLIVDDKAEIAVLRIYNSSSRQDELLALHANGSILWRFGGRSEDYEYREVKVLVALYESRVFAIIKTFAPDDHLLYAVDAKSGEVLWKTPIEDPYGFEVIHEDVILFREYVDLGGHWGCSNLHVFNIHTGEELWNFGLPMFWTPAFIFLEDSIANGTIYLQVSENPDFVYNELLAINTSTGQVRWQCRTEEAMMHYVWIDNNLCYFWTWDTRDYSVYRFHCIDQKK